MKNNRTFLEKLLDGAEVEWKTIAEISNKVSSGGTPTTSNNNYYENGNIPWLRTQEVDFKEIWNTDLKITEEGLNNSSAKWIPKNCVIVAMYGATVGKIAINKIPLTTNQACANIEVNPEIAHYRYVFHYLMSKYEYIKSLGSGSQTNINSQIVKKIRIPIPPLSVQTEIVKILDVLTALTSELTSELILRQKQYEYYREKLLSFDSLEQLNSGGGGKKKLIDVAIYAKSRISTDKLNKENYIGVENLLQNKLGKTSSNYVPTEGSFIEYLPDDILIGNIRPYLRKIWLADKTGGTNGDVLVIRLTDENIIPRYLYHILANEHFFEYNIKYSKGAKMPRGDKSAILQYEFDVPPLEQQQRIVSILDKFETLTNSITDGLPLAIEQSQKRYEYYRELLLNFE